MTWAALVGGLVLALVGEPASPAPGDEGAGKVEFIWDAPAGCPEPAAVTKKVEAILGGPLDAARARRVSAIARVRRGEQGRWEMRLYTVTPEETRERDLSDESCETLADATAIVVATAIDPSVDVSRPSPEARIEDREDGEDTAETEDGGDVEDRDAIEGDPPIDEPLPEPAAAARPSPAPAPAPTPSPVRRSSPRGFVRVAGGVAFAELPGATGLASIGAGVLWPRARIEVVASGVPGRRVTLDASARPRVGLHVWSVGAVGCGVPLVVEPRGETGRASSTWELPLCAGIEAGEVLARPHGLADARGGREPWVAAIAGPRLAWSPRPILALVVALEVVVPLLRPAFAVESYGDVARVGPAGGRATLGIELRLPRPPRIAPAGGH